MGLAGVLPVPRVLREEMKRYLIKWLIPTLVVAFIAFVASPNGPLGSFWRPSPDILMPTGAQLLLFTLLNVAGALTFGIGISFLIFGYPVVQHILPRSRGLAFGISLVRRRDNACMSRLQESCRKGGTQ